MTRTVSTVLLAILMVLLLASPATANPDHADEVGDAQEDLETARSATEETLTTIGIGVLWGLGTGVLVGAGAALMLTGKEGHR